MQSNPDTERVVQFYAESWIKDDRNAVRQMISPDAHIEWNLDAPVDDEQLVQTLHRIVDRAESVAVVSQLCTDDRAALVYDCTTSFGTVRIAEFLTVAQGRIAEVRQVHDPLAIRRYFPDLLED